MRLTLTKAELEDMRRKAQVDITTQNLPFGVRLALLELATACLKVSTIIDFMEKEHD